eukprot:3103622-Rhodomonas_salina.2
MRVHLTLPARARRELRAWRMEHRVAGMAHGAHRVHSIVTKALRCARRVSHRECAASGASIACCTHRVASIELQASSSQFEMHASSSKNRVRNSSSAHPKSHAHRE